MNFDSLIYVNASVSSSIEITAPRTMTSRTSFNFQEGERGQIVSEEQFSERLRLVA